MSYQSLDYTILIKESIEELSQLLANKSQSVRRQERVKFLYLLKTGTCTSQVSAGEQIGIKARQSQKLWSIYVKEGITTLLSNGYKGGNHSYLNKGQEEELLARLDKDDLITQSQVIAYVHQSFQVKYSSSGISKKLKRMKVKAKTGRPVNIRKDEQGEEAFKKTFMP